MAISARFVRATATSAVCFSGGKSVYIDSNMGHAYTVAAGHDEALLLGICTCADEQLLGALLNLHEDPAMESSIVRPRLPAGEAARATPIDKRRGNRSQAGKTKTTGKRGR